MEMEFLEEDDPATCEDEQEEDVGSSSIQIGTKTEPIPLPSSSRVASSLPTQSAPSDYVRVLSESFQAMGTASVPSSSFRWNLRRGNQALQYRRPGRILEIALPIQEPGPYEVVIQVTHAGVSDYDLKVVSDAFPFVSKIVPGREVTGKIVDIGKNVTHAALGDTVVVDPEYTSVADGGSKSLSFQERKAIGMTHNGGWAQYLLVTGIQVHRIPNDLPGPWATMIYEVACIVSAWKKIQPVSEADRILILCNGIAGFLWGLYLRLKNFDVELCQCQTSYSLSIHQLDFTVVHRESLETGAGIALLDYDIIVDTTGNYELMDLAFQWLKPMGKFLLYGLPSGASHSNKWCLRDILDKEATICGSISHSRGGFAEAVHAARKLSKYSLESLGVNLYSISDYQNALSDLKSGRCTKVIFTVQDPSRRSFLSSPSSPILSPFDAPKFRVPHLYL
ncbi:uncharacterized protein Gasu_07560 [Galdieria sulphuraria]|uniref:Alcohol dehydrogenase-like N-terminal domain-containing protein n=1 Tax=Galdieria sulphuraria TaxID=130081 RepID=M2X678_GALSU|nr:uncharacterized protein Gasu_07560 [Galdieria sulphuraria]EME32010.1 hypothetical protein Gasu_07560 [Galdieria sulphuraria]|eukprot:XP_005708530.1 hypothetical protein Gasu_07560 [Galdieria sulphuraria]